MNGSETSPVSAVFQPSVMAQSNRTGLGNLDLLCASNFHSRAAENKRKVV